MIGKGKFFFSSLHVFIKEVHGCATVILPSCSPAGIEALLSQAIITHQMEGRNGRKSILDFHLAIIIKKRDNKKKTKIYTYPRDIMKNSNIFPCHIAVFIATTTATRAALLVPSCEARLSLLTSLASLYFMSLSYVLIDVTVSTLRI